MEPNKYELVFPKSNSQEAQMIMLAIQLMLIGGFPSVKLLAERRRNDLVGLA